MIHTFESVKVATIDRGVLSTSFVSKTPFVGQIKQEILSLLKSKTWIKSIHVVGSYVGKKHVSGLASDLDVLIFVEEPYTTFIRQEIKCALEYLTRHHAENINICHSMQMGPQRVFVPNCATLLVHTLVYTMPEYRKQSKLVRASWQSHYETLYGSPSDVSDPRVEFTQHDILYGPFGIKDLIRGATEEVLPFCVWVEDGKTLRKTIQYCKPDPQNAFQRQDFILYSGYHALLNYGRFKSSASCDDPDLLIASAIKHLPHTLSSDIQRVISLKHKTVKGVVLEKEEMSQLKEIIGHILTVIANDCDIG